MGNHERSEAWGPPLAGPRDQLGHLRVLEGPGSGERKGLGTLGRILNGCAESLGSGEMSRMLEECSGGRTGIQGT